MTSQVKRIAGVILVDEHGQLLLQERDEFAPTNPNLWGLVGGHIEPGETYAAGALRELQEETGLSGIALTVVSEWTFEPPDPAEWQVFAARCPGLTDADIVLGEGRQIRFVAQDQVLALPLADTARLVLTDFLASPAYLDRAAQGQQTP